MPGFLAQIRDRRALRGCRYPLPYLLARPIVAMPTGDAFLGWLEIRTRLAQVSQGLVVGKQVERLLHRLVLSHRDQHHVGTSVAGDREMVVLPSDPVGQFSDPGLLPADAGPVAVAVPKPVEITSLDPVVADVRSIWDAEVRACVARETRVDAETCTGPATTPAGVR